MRSVQIYQVDLPWDPCCGWDEISSSDITLWHTLSRPLASFNFNAASVLSAVAQSHWLMWWARGGGGGGQGRRRRKAESGGGRSSRSPSINREVFRYWFLISIVCRVFRNFCDIFLVQLGRRHPAVLAAEMAGPLTRLNCIPKGNFGKEKFSASFRVLSEYSYNRVPSLFSAVNAIVWEFLPLTLIT